MKKKILFSILIIVSIFNILSNTVFAIDDTQNLPTSYDLRNDIDINVENQGQRGWCSAYATTKMIETYLQKTKGINYNLSEAYMAYSEASYFGGSNSHIKDIQSVNYYAVEDRWSKQVLEKDFPNVDYAFTQENKEKFDNANVVIKSVKAKPLNENNEIKNYLINKGAARLGLSTDEKWYNSSTSAIYCPTTDDYISYMDDIMEDGHINYEEETKLSYEVGFHAAIIIGWDDNYSRNNFKSSCRPQNDGAWLILNSWGRNWGNNGTAWVSYEDVYVNGFDKFGIENVLFKGELNANFSYRLGEYSQKKDGKSEETKATYIATISTDDEVEDIEGWETHKYSTSYATNYFYTKTFTEKFEPYTIELISKTDGAKTTVDVNIPEKFEEIIVGNKLNMILNDYVPIILVIIIFIVFIILIKKLVSLPSKLYKKVSKKKQPKNINDKNK